MSDDFDFEMDDEVDFEDDGSQAGSAPEWEIEIENKYYEAKGEMDDEEHSSARDKFLQVLDEDQDKGEWSYKALKQLVKCEFSLKSFDAMSGHYAQLLDFTWEGQTRNGVEETIGDLLDYLSTASPTLLLDLYHKTLDAVSSGGAQANDRLWFSTKMKLAKIEFDNEDWPSLQKSIQALYKSCQKDDGTDDPKKGTNLLQIYALEIQMYTERKETKKLKALYEKSLNVTSAIPPPRIMGIIRECGGKMFMEEKQWEQAYNSFFAAFKNYDEAGHPRRIHCLKYLVIANMLSNSTINPFDSTEAKPYKNDAEILAMTNLVDAYQRNDIDNFERILKTNKKTIMDDSFIRAFIEDLMVNVRTQVLLKLTRPYHAIRMRFIAELLNVDEKAVQALLVQLLLDQKIDGAIDQVNGLLQLYSKKGGQSRFAACEKWISQLGSLHATLVGKIG